jgi:hypothetical protein
MVQDSGVKEIGKIQFRDRLVPVYYDKTGDKNNISCSWQMRNPDSCYQGVMWMNWETGRVTYPEGAVIPEQTAEDREMLPKFLIISQDSITDKIHKCIIDYLDKSYKERNNIK